MIHSILGTVYAIPAEVREGLKRVCKRVKTEDRALCLAEGGVRGMWCCVSAAANAQVVLFVLIVQKKNRVFIATRLACVSHFGDHMHPC